MTTSSVPAATKTTKTLSSRLAWTIIPPLLLLVLTPYITLPGVDRNAVEAILAKQSFLGMFASGSTRNLSVFALGLGPVVSAYAFVELVAIVVPRLSRMRHGNPRGRDKLDRTARVLALLLAAVQAWSMAKSLEALTAGPSADIILAPQFGTVSMPVATASLVGGVCVSLLVASFVTRQGLVNGIVLITTLDGLDELRRALSGMLIEKMQLADLPPIKALGLAVVLVVPMIATWLALRDAPSGNGGVREEDKPDGLKMPYRHARSLALHPDIPIPASAIAPFFFSSSLLLLPLTLLPFFPSAQPLVEAITSGSTSTFTVVLLLITLVVGVVFARLLHRPRELADLVSRLGSGNRTEAEVEARGAIARALPATLLFLATLVLAAAASGSLGFGWPSSLALPLLVAIAMDVRRAIGAYVRAPDLVSVWQERRAAAVPVLRAVLEAEGITVETSGTRVLRLLQVFAPYTCAELLVRAEDAPRASAILRHLLLGEEAPERVPTAAPTRPDLARTLDEKAPGSISARSRVIGLVLCASAVLAPWLLASVRSSARAEPGAAPRPQLEVVRVDDEIDPFATIADSNLPAGIEIRMENAPLGGRQAEPRRTERRTFATTELVPGETPIGAAARMRAWLTTMPPLPPGKRFAFEATEDYNPESGKSTVKALRTFVLTGETILTTDDVVDAQASVDSRSGMSEVYVAITLRPEAADRFAEATDEWTNRRIAIVLDSMINSAPVVRTRIGGGRLSITMGAGDPEKQLAEAKSLATGLAGR